MMFVLNSESCFKVGHEFAMKNYLFGDIKVTIETCLKTASTDDLRNHGNVLTRFRIEVNAIKIFSVIPYIA